ncbi:MAG: PmoA family protein [Lunatimonas sp.]|uniref:DUF6807 domain-containing protein n=1 Tax=Lunatimonas sp. TaxID=2060141 RepID=UPI00263BDCBD|nr:PmoA family protein [Lunatimonas sp.]MCC5936844.1 PmoA family protein [Lunatimonas sp.]
MIRNFLLVVFCGLLLTISQQVKAQRIATLKIDLEENPEFAFPVSVDLDEITHLADTLLQLVELSQGNPQPIAYQIHRDEGRRLYWMVAPSQSGATQRTYELQRKKDRVPASSLSIAMDEKAIYIRKKGNDLWQYNHAVNQPPVGVNPAYARSGFVHPMWSPTGKSLTRIQPPDHYHHYGLWNPWTRAEFRGQTIDFWNLADEQGTVRYANTISRIQGPVFAGYEVLHEHVVLKDQPEPLVAMVEQQGTRIYTVDADDDVYLADIRIALHTATDEPVILKEYRYGSLGWRTTEKWDRYNSEVITSGGNTRKDADGTLATWCIVQGEIDDDYAAVIMMSSPTNYNHPEPLRIWPENMYDRGDMYANFAPTKNMDWTIDPGKQNVLNYRFLVSAKKLTAEQAERAWRNFANPPKPTVTVH